MSFLDRFRQPRWYEMVDYTAIPLTPKEVALFVEGLQQSHRLARRARPDIGGISSSASYQADAMLSRAGIAAAVGNSTVPVLCTELSMLDYAVNDFHRHAPRSDLGRRFENLVSKMKVLAGAARVHGWTAKLTPTTVWEQEPNTSGVLRRLGIES